MKNLSEAGLRQYIRLVLEAYASNVDGPHLSNLMSPHLAQRDEIPYLGVKRKKGEEEISFDIIKDKCYSSSCNILYCSNVLSYSIIKFFKWLIRLI